jgi:hypothetical protein
MKKTIQLFLLLFLMSTVGKAQIPGSINLYISPSNPTTSDIITLTSEAVFPSGGYSLFNSSTEIINNQITILSTHILGDATYICENTSEFEIGTLEEGVYQLIYEQSTIYTPTVETNSNTLYFTVQEATDCNQIITELNIPLNLTQGWNMIGYTCVEPLNTIEAFSSVEDKIIIVKDNVGNSYLPDWEFNGIGDLEFAKGYQLKITEDITDFYFCPTLIYSE